MLEEANALSADDLGGDSPYQRMLFLRHCDRYSMTLPGSRKHVPFVHPLYGRNAPCGRSHSTISPWKPDP